MAMRQFDYRLGAAVPVSPHESGASTVQQSAAPPSARLNLSRVLELLQKRGIIADWAEPSKAGGHVGLTVSQPAVGVVWVPEHAITDSPSNIDLVNQIVTQIRYTEDLFRAGEASKNMPQSRKGWRDWLKERFP